MWLSLAFVVLFWTAIITVIWAFGKQAFLDLWWMKTEIRLAYECGEESHSRTKKCWPERTCHQHWCRGRCSYVSKVQVTAEEGATLYQWLNYCRKGPSPSAHLSLLVCPGNSSCSSAGCLCLLEHLLTVMHSRSLWCTLYKAIPNGQAILPQYFLLA